MCSFADFLQHVLETLSSHTGACKIPARHERRVFISHAVALQLGSGRRWNARGEEQTRRGGRASSGRFFCEHRYLWPSRENSAASDANCALHQTQTLEIQLASDSRLTAEPRVLTATSEDPLGNAAAREAPICLGDCAAGTRVGCKIDTEEKLSHSRLADLHAVLLVDDRRSPHLIGRPVAMSMFIGSPRENLAMLSPHMLTTR